MKLFENNEGITIISVVKHFPGVLYSNEHRLGALIPNNSTAVTINPKMPPDGTVNGWQWVRAATITNLYTNVYQNLFCNTFFLSVFQAKCQTLSGYSFFYVLTFLLLFYFVVIYDIK